MMGGEQILNLMTLLPSFKIAAGALLCRHLLRKHYKVMSGDKQTH